MPYVYKITNQINQKIYIGKTMYSDPLQRWSEHRQEATRDQKNHRPLYSAINKYGFNNFSFEVIEECSDIELNDREKFWIEYYGSFKNGYNATCGGDGTSYLDYDLVIATYNEVGIVKKTAELLGIQECSVSRILKARSIEIPIAKDVLRDKYGKIVNMYSLKDEYLQSFQTLGDAAKYMISNNLTGCKEGTIRTHISEVCNGKRKTAAKFKWKFANV